MKASLLFSVCLGASGVFAEDAPLRLHPLFGHHAVLQAGVDLPVRGWAAPGAAVTVSPSWSKDPVQTSADAAGKWTAGLKAPAAGGPHSLRVESAGQILVSTNLVAGEVWLCSGQSNMEWPLKNTDGGKETAAAALHPDLRFFAVPKLASPSPRETAEARWEVCTPETAALFSGIGVHFALALQRETKRPVGMIGSYWGGTRVEPWIDEETLRAKADYSLLVEQLEFARQADGGDEATRDAALRARMLDLLSWADPGIQAGWAREQLPPHGWRETEGPVDFDRVSPGAPRDGILWCRKAVVLPPAAAGRAATIHLGALDDRDVVWINGRQIGDSLRDQMANVQRVYAVPAGVLKEGTNSVAVLLLDTSGPGGMNWAGVEPRIQWEGGHAPLSGTWLVREGADLAALPRIPSGTRGLGAATPAALYMGMIHPVAGYPLRGFLWYQGESNVGEHESYLTRFPALIHSWRKVWNHADLPFYFVQIAPFDYTGRGRSQFLRDAQRQSLAVPGTGMVVTTDIGNPKDIHPRNKKDVGERLARLALRNQYGRSDLAASGPLYESMRIEGGAIRIRFHHAEGGLVARGGELSHFEIAGRDRIFKPASAAMDGATLRVYNPEVAAPVAVRFGWSDTAEPNLFNAAGLPASPFRTDDWPE
jgi:sialate O-acetylesterase